MALHQSQGGTEHEHWSIQFHPQKSHKTATWHVVDALSAKGANGVLQTDLRTKGGEKGGGYDASKQENVLMKAISQRGRYESPFFFFFSFYSWHGGTIL